MATRCLQDRIALVTGASRGIGRAVAVRYAKEGAKLILVARTPGALEEVDDEIRAVSGTGAMLVPMDLKNGELIDKLGLALHERYGRLDILVGNAAILGGLQPIHHYTPDAWNNIIEVNLNANWRLIRSLDPLLRLSPAGRVLFVTSRTSETMPAYWGPYTVSKSALESLVFSYAKELKRTNIKVNIIDPGIAATDMRAEAFPGENPETLVRPEDIAHFFVDPVMPANIKSGKKIFATKTKSTS